MDLNELCRLKGEAHLNIEIWQNKLSQINQKINLKLAEPKETPKDEKSSD